MKASVLIVDDDPGLRRALADRFEHWGHRTETAADGVAAHAVLAKQVFDLVLLDLNMDDLGGDECCLRIKENPDLKATPVLIMTHANWEEDIARARKAKCDDVILKPVNRQHLLKTVRELLLISDRTEDRVDATLPLHFGCLTDDEKGGFTVDVSVGGVFVRDSETIPPGTPVTVTLPLPGEEEEVKCRGTVAWVNNPKHVTKEDYPDGIGIQFVDLNPHYKDAIHRYVKKVLSSDSE